MRDFSSLHLIFHAMLVFLSHDSMAQPTGQLCPEVDGNSESCVCKSSNGIIDLRALSNRDGTPRFKGVKDSHHYYYDFNPCQGIVYENCINLHICQGTSLDSTVHYDIAYQGGEEIWIDNSEGPYLYYTGPGNRESKVYLHCDRSLASGEEKLTTTGDTITKLTYLFDLYSCHACPGGCDAIQGSVGIIGLVFILLVILVFLVYLAMGATIMKFHLGMEGRDIMPHRDFWNDLPYLVQDGFQFTVGSFIDVVKKKFRRTTTHEDNTNHS